MQASHNLAGVAASFDEPNLVPCAGLLPAAALAQRLGMAGVVDERLTLARHGANSGLKAMTVMGAMLAGGDSIDDVVLRRSGALPQLLDLSRAPSTIGIWLRDFKWHNVRQLDAIQVGGSVGLAVLATIAATASRGQLGTHPVAVALTTGYTDAFRAGAVIILLAVPLALVLLRLRPSASTNPDPTGNHGADNTSGTDTALDAVAVTPCGLTPIRGSSYRGPAT